MAGGNVIPSALFQHMMAAGNDTDSTNRMTPPHKGKRQQRGTITPIVPTHSVKEDKLEVVSSTEIVTDNEKAVENDKQSEGVAPSPFMATSIQQETSPKLGKTRPNSSKKRRWFSQNKVAPAFIVDEVNSFSPTSFGSESLSAPVEPPTIPQAPPVHASGNEIGTLESASILYSTETTPEISEQELLEHQKILKKLRSTSSGNIITVAPAPADKRSSYLQHRNSKLGIENISSISNDNLASLSETSSLEHQENNHYPKQMSFNSIQTVRVLPINSPTLGTIEIRELDQRADHRHNDVDDDGNGNIHHDLVLEDINDSETEPVPSLALTSHPPVNDIKLMNISDEYDESMENQSKKSPATTYDKSEHHSTTADQHEAMTVKDECQSQLTSEEEIQPNAHESDLFISDVVDDTKANSKLKFDHHINAPTIIDDECDSNIHTIKRGKILLPPLELTDSLNAKNKKNIQDEQIKDGPVDAIEPEEMLQAVTENEEHEEIIIEEFQEEKEKQTDACMPLLRAKSTTSLYGTTYESKRKRNPPEYFHHRQNKVLSPPCPPFGTIQPTEYEMFNTSLKQLRLSETNNNIETVIGSPIHQSLTQTIHNDVSTILSSSFHLPQTDNTINIDILLHLAANEGNARKVSLLLNEGHDVNGIDKEGRTPLMYCVLPSGAVQLHCADILLQAGANLDQQAHDGSTVLHVASIVGSIPYMEMLLLNGSNPLIRDNDGRLPIHWSTVPTSAKPILLLLQESRCDVNVTDCSDMTPLMWACYHKNLTIAKQLLNEGADVEEKDYEGNTAMHWSVMKSDIECLQLLLKQDMTYFKNRNGCTVLHIAAREGFIRGIQYILTLRPDSIHDTDKMGRTPLHYSAATERVDVCYLLLNNGADATRKDFKDKTPLDYALTNENEYAVALFTCHNKSIDSFSKINRLEGQRFNDDESFISESLSLMSLSEDDGDSASTKALNEISVRRGSYLGLFTEDMECPPQHYYFWINLKHKKLCWSRSKNKQHKRQAVVKSVQLGASPLVTNRNDYSPNDLHIYTFNVVTETKSIDLLAYSENSYRLWTEALKCLSISVTDTTVSTTSANNQLLTSTPLSATCNSSKTSVLHDLM